jgi:hypothetical protein
MKFFSPTLSAFLGIENLQAIKAFKKRFRAAWDTLNICPEREKCIAMYVENIKTENCNN